MPMDRSKYPKDWPQIRARTLERAGHKCEVCGVPNYSEGQRGANGQWYTVREIDGMNSDDGWHLFGHLDNPFKVSRIVLTTSHTDHDTTNNEPHNLRALCQRCHLAHDHELHKANAARTRKRRAGLQDLFPTH